MTGLPSVVITFQSVAQAAIEQGQVGIVALVLKDSSVTSEVVEHIMTTISDIPVGLSAVNKVFIEDAFVGSPKQVKAICIPSASADYSAAYTYLETISFDIVTIPGIATADVANFATWAKGVYDNNGQKILAIVPSNVADHESVVNFDTDDIEVDGSTITTEDFLARIAGLIGGLSLTVAPTYQVLSEVDDVPHLTKSQADALVDAGKLILFHDGEKVKIARGVTSLTTIGTKSADFKKIKIVRILNKVYTDIKRTIEDNYIGKVQNSYVNKLLLVSAIGAYFDVLEQSSILDAGKNSCTIDVDAQKAYLKSKGIDVTKLSEQQIKEYNTDDQVFLKATVVPLDAIEDITLKINI